MSFFLFLDGVLLFFFGSVRRGMQDTVEGYNILFLL
jgi:hypothetical protein